MLVAKQSLELFQLPRRPMLCDICQPFDNGPHGLVGVELPRVEGQRRGGHQKPCGVTSDFAFEVHNVLATSTYFETRGSFDFRNGFVSTFVLDKDLL